MKKILLSAFLFVSSMVFGQSKEALKDVKEATFYGVDYSHVGIVGAAESSSKFIFTFDEINSLIQREYSKYIKKLAKKTKVDIVSVDLGPVNQLNSGITTESLDRPSIVTPFEETELQDIINSIDFKKDEGYGVILIAEELNKPRNRGIYELVFFDLANKQIITHAKISGKSRGFGLRNFWANSIHSTFKDISLRR